MTKSTKTSRQSKPESLTPTSRYSHTLPADGRKRSEESCTTSGRGTPPKRHSKSLIGNGHISTEGRIPPSVETGEGCTFRLLCNTFLNSKAEQAGVRRTLGDNVSELLRNQ